MVWNKPYDINYPDSFNGLVSSETVHSTFECPCLKRELMTFEMLELLKMSTSHNYMK